jgi:hypothetical protein
MSLESRVGDFDILQDLLETVPAVTIDRISPLICKIHPDDVVYPKPSPPAYNNIQRLYHAIAVFIGECIPSRYPLHPDDVIGALNGWKNAIPCMTPNGMLVPKSHSATAYNVVVQRFAELMDGLSIAPVVSSWHIPLNIRVKYGVADRDNLKRHHPTEHIHSDSWAGESSHSVTVHIPLFGDLENNHVRFYNPPDDFQENWLGARTTYMDGEDIASRYSIIETWSGNNILTDDGNWKVFHPTIGDIVLADFASLHESYRNPGAGTRVSIDTTFAMKRGEDRGEVIHKWREGERASHSELCGIGKDFFMRFPDTEDMQVDSSGGFKHPSNLEMVNLRKIHHE